MVDLTKTRAQLIIQVLDNLNVVGTGQTASAEETAKVDGYVDPALAELSAKSIVDVPDSEEIPLEVFLGVAAVIANECAPSFDRAGDQGLAAAAAAAESKLRTVTRPSGTKPRLSVDRALRSRRTTGLSSSGWSSGRF